MSELDSGVDNALYAKDRWRESFNGGVLFIKLSEGTFSGQVPRKRCIVNLIPATPVSNTNTGVHLLSRWKELPNKDLWH